MGRPQLQDHQNRCKVGTMAESLTLGEEVKNTLSTLVVCRIQLYKRKRSVVATAAGMAYLRFVS